MTQPPPIDDATPNPYAPPPPPPRRSARLPTAALVLGICAAIPAVGVICAALAVVFGILSLIKGKPRMGFAIAGLVLGLILTPLQISVLLPSIARARALAQRTACKKTMEGLARGIAIYAEQHGQFPASLEAVVKDGIVDPACLKCIGTRSERACDYFYLKPAPDAPDDAFMICDFRDNHGGDGRNVILRSGNSILLMEDDFQRRLSQPANAAFAAALRGVEKPGEEGGGKDSQ